MVFSQTSKARITKRVVKGRPVILSSVAPKGKDGTKKKKKQTK